MMPPGHIAATWGVAAMWQSSHSRLDYRLLAFCAMLPDFLDKPLALLVFTHSNSTQNIAHSLLFHAAILTLVLLYKPRWLPYTLAFNAHLPADHMWYHPETFWWPLFGWNVFWSYKPMNTPAEMLAVYVDIIRHYPHVWLVEVIALIILGWFGWRYRLYDWPNLKALLLIGRLNTPPFCTREKL